MSLSIATGLKKIVPGQMLAMSYSAPEGKFGEFSLDTAGKELIPENGTSNPDGYFYFICVGYDNAGNKKLVADRNIQTNISWEALNSAGLCSYSGYTIDSLGAVKNVTVRLMFSASSAFVPGEEKILTEWDEIITNSSINEHIVPSDSTIWHTASSYSWVIDTPQSDMGQRVVRGVQDKEDAGTTFMQQSFVSTATMDNIGFRPVLLVPQDSEQSFTEIIPSCDCTIREDIFLSLPGEAIPCNYTVMEEGQVGTFSLLGISKKTGISAQPPAVPDGTFYWINVGFDSSGAMKFVADRNIQSSISWDALNAAGLCSVNSGYDASSLTGVKGSYIRLLQSGVVNRSMDRNSSEWDAIIFNDTIGQSDEPVSKVNGWSYEYCKSWMMNTPSEDDSGMTKHSMSMRVVRGMESNDYSSIQRTFSDSNIVSERIGFRPVLIIPLDTQTAIVKATVTPNHSFEQDVEITGTFGFITKDCTLSTTTVEYFLDDAPFHSIETDGMDNTIVPEDYDISLTIPKDRLEYGQNKFHILVTANGVQNGYNYVIIREKLGDINRNRDMLTYAGGYEYNDTAIDSSGAMCLTDSKKLMTPKAVKLPKNLSGLRLEDA